MKGDARRPLAPTDHKRLELPPVRQRSRDYGEPVAELNRSCCRSAVVEKQQQVISTGLRFSALGRTQGGRGTKRVPHPIVSGAAFSTAGWPQFRKNRPANASGKPALGCPHADDSSERRGSRDFKLSDRPGAAFLRSSSICPSGDFACFPADSHLFPF